MRDKKIGVELWISGCTGRGYVKPKKDVPGLLWAEFVQLMDEWGKFKQKREGTRFDNWLDEEDQTPRIKADKIHVMAGRFINTWYRDDIHTAKVISSPSEGRCIIEFLTGPRKGKRSDVAYYPEQNIGVFITAKEALKYRNYRRRKK